MEIIINGKVTCVSNENEEMLNELVYRLINEDVSGLTGEADFDVNSPSNDVSIRGGLDITYSVDTEKDNNVPKNMDDYNGFTEPMDETDGSKEPMD